MIACYDLKHCPPTYDVVAFLMKAEAERKRRKESVIDLHILPGPREGFRSDGLWPYSIAERQALLDNVCVPMCKMLPTVLGVTVEKDRGTFDWEGEFGHNAYHISLDNIVEGIRTGGRCLRYPQPVQKELDLITFTLREADHWPMRNSRVTEWVQAACDLELRGFRVVFVRDTLRATHPIPGFEIAPEASRDLFARARLYSSALLNVGISNGPMWFTLALDAPMAMLRPTTETTAGPFNNDFFRNYGLPPDTQLPNTPPHQRLFWREDSSRDIVSSVNEMVDAISH